MYSQQIEMASVYTPWAVKNGLSGKFLMNVHFEKHFEEPLSDLRKQLNLTGPPIGSLKYNNVWKNNK